MVAKRAYMNDIGRGKAISDSLLLVYDFSSDDVYS